MWTKEIPKEAGFYFWRSSTERGTLVIELDDNGYVTTLGDEQVWHAKDHKESLYWTIRLLTPPPPEGMR